MLSGQRVGGYHVQERIGAGGMGEVYRARDTRLGRDVAIKILPSAFTSDPERLARFEREARMLAALNHPNIATIHGFEEGSGTPALVMELVTGETLAERIGRGPVPVPEALTVAAQIVEALDAAHEKGIVHRDLKPANIKITPAGTVKVLDFGLAKAIRPDEPESGHSSAPTMTVGTREGLVVGTAASSDGGTLYYSVSLRPSIFGNWGSSREVRRAEPPDGPSTALARVAAGRIPISPGMSGMMLSPDDRWLSMPLTDGTTTNIWLLPTSGDAMKPITDFGSRMITIARHASWSADGRHVYAAVAETETDIVLLEGLT